LGKLFKAHGKSKKNVRAGQDYDDNVIDESPAAVDDIETYYIDPLLVTGLEPQSIEAEQFRLLKNNILFPEKGTPPKSIMITSFSPSEGKSFVAANLAISIAQNIDEYVLLIDCDLRSPSIQSMFGLVDSPGLSEYLSEERPLSSLLVRSFLDKLTILPAGEIPANPSELLSSDRMKKLILEVKSRYSDRYIIFDTPPPHLTSETNAISRQVDGIVIVVQQGKTRKKEVLDLVEIYGKDKILGVVYNFAKKRTGYGYGYGKYGYGRK
jgi:exopolysaccharide/PEP-CTERM locus tyrosine autokinase